MVWYQYVASAVAVIATAFLVPEIIKDKKAADVWMLMAFRNPESLNEKDMEKINNFLRSSNMDINKIEKAWKEWRESNNKQYMLDLLKEISPPTESTGGKTRRRNTRNRNTRRNKSKKITKRNKSKKLTKRNKSKKRSRKR